MLDLSVRPAQAGAPAHRSCDASVPGAAAPRYGGQLAGAGRISAALALPAAGAALAALAVLARRRTLASA